MRQDGQERILFLCHVRDEIPARPRIYRIRIRGLWRVQRMNALDGAVQEMGGTQEDVAEFEKRFTEKFHHLKCSELRGILRGKCNDYVGVSASIISQMGIMKEQE